MLTCVWGGDRYGWGSAPILALIATSALASIALIVRERSAQDPVVPLHLLRTRPVAVASGALFFTTAALFAVTVFVPLYLQVETGATPTQAGLLLAPAMAGIAISTTLAGRSITRTGRYKRFPIAGLGLMTLSLLLLAALVGDGSRVSIGVAIAVFGLGFGMVSQVLIIAVQNSVERRDLGVATATTGFFRALGGAIGAAMLGAVFSASVGQAPGADVTDGIRVVFLVAAPLAAIALLTVLLLREVPLRTSGGPARATSAPQPAHGDRS
jgi:predicted MFS family arabinose efflux permease